MKRLLILLTAGFLCKYNTAEDPCEDGWIYDPDEDLGKCYYVNPTKVTLLKSVHRCEEIGGYLACIATKNETEFIKRKLSELGFAETEDNNQYWIGLYRGTTTGQSLQDGWVWIDHTTYGWRNWFVREPNEGERCARLMPHADWLWAGALCDSEDDHFKFGYICEKNAHVTSTVAITSKNTRPSTITSTASTTTAPATVRRTTGPFQTGKPGGETSDCSKDKIYIGFGTALGCLCVIFVVVIIIVVWKLRTRHTDTNSTDPQNKIDVIEYENPSSINVGTHETPVDSGTVVVYEPIQDGVEEGNTERETYGEVNNSATQEEQDTVEYEGLRDRITSEQTYKAYTCLT